MALTPSSASTWTMISAPLMAWPARGCATGLVWSATSVIGKAYQFSQSPQNSVILPRGQPLERLAVAHPMRHIIGILLQNEAGALARVAGMFSSRGYNIESLSVAATDDPTVSRLTLVTTGSDAVILQITNQLNKLIDVVRIDDITPGEHVERELVLAKLRVAPVKRDALRGYVVRTRRPVLDPSTERFIVELLGSEADVNGFMREVATHGELLEVVRSGPLGISRTARALHLVDPG